MHSLTLLTRVAQGFILLSALALLSVSVMAFTDPQSVMNLVNVQLTNTDAFSSIRGAYGGVGLTLFISLLYLMLHDIRKGLLFLTLLWGSYTLSRIVTIFAEGNLGAFGQQWLIIESILCLIGVTLLITSKRSLGSNQQRA
ncbi:DUF4345 domain-containing protein [Spirosoma pomorum]|jgi:hypothetical protein